jgi:hypothetical protein
MVPILVMSFHCDKQPVDMVRRTGSARWRKHTPQMNDTVLLWIVTSPDSHLMSTAGCSPAWLKWRFVVEDAESSSIGHLALVKMIATGPIYQTARMVIVQKWHQPPMQPLHDRSNHFTPHVSIGTTYIVPIACTLEGAVHFVPLTPHPDSSR